MYLMMPGKRGGRVGVQDRNIQSVCLFSIAVGGAAGIPELSGWQKWLLTRVFGQTASLCVIRLVKQPVCVAAGLSSYHNRQFNQLKQPGRSRAPCTPHTKLLGKSVPQGAAMHVFLAAALEMKNISEAEADQCTK